MTRRRLTKERRLEAACALAADYRRLAVRLTLSTADALAAIHGGGVSRRRLVNVLRARVALREDEADLRDGPYGVFDQVPAAWLEALIENAIDEGYIEIASGGSPGRLAVTDAGDAAARGRDQPPGSIVPATPRLGENAALEEALRSLRRDLARRDERAPYAVFPNDTLAALAARKPTTLAELALVSGFGEARLRRYGRRVLATIRKIEQSPQSKSARA